MVFIALFVQPPGLKRVPTRRHDKNPAAIEHDNEPRLQRRGRVHGVAPDIHDKTVNTNDKIHFLFLQKFYSDTKSIRNIRMIRNFCFRMCAFAYPRPLAEVALFVYYYNTNPHTLESMGISFLI